jgi:hypothetical protein
MKYALGEGWGARGVKRGFAADFVFRKMGGRGFVGLKPHAPSVW